MRHLVVVPSLLAIASLSACGLPTFDAGAAAQALLKRDAEWAQLATEGKDVDRIVSYWADDARVIEPGQPIFAGKEAIRAYVGASLKVPGFRIHWVSETPVFSSDGTLAYMPGVDEVTAPGPDGQLTTVHMRGISVWRREPDGVWRCVIDIANAAPLATSGGVSRQ